MSSNKYTSFLAVSLLLLLLFLSLSQARRLEPADQRINGQGKGFEDQTSSEKMDEGCDHEEGQEECLMRRTLAASTDYIYTQNKHN